MSSPPMLDPEWTPARGYSHAAALMAILAAADAPAPAPEPIEAPAECPHGYPDSCPDCDSPSYLPSVLDRRASNGRRLRDLVDHLGRGSYGV